jgi:hypothetical protein
MSSHVPWELVDSGDATFLKLFGTEWRFEQMFGVFHTSIVEIKVQNRSICLVYELNDSGLIFFVLRVDTEWLPVIIVDVACVVSPTCIIPLLRVISLSCVTSP